MRRARWIALAVLLAMLFAGDYFYWRFAISQLRAEFDNWASRTQAAGGEVRFGKVSAGGWPDAATLRIENLSVAATGLPSRQGAGLGTVRWGAGAVVLRARLTRPDVLEVTPVDPDPIRIGNGPPIPVSTDRLHLRIAMGLNGPPRAIDVEAVTLTVSLPGLGLLGIGDLSVHADLKLDAGRDQAAVAFALSAHPVSLPDGIHWGLGPEIAEIVLRGVVNGPLTTGANVANRATAWRDEGGSLEIHRLAVGWGQTRIEATATLALDEDLQPMGTGTGKIAGFGAALDALAANAVLTRSAAKAAKAVLSLLANTPADGQPEEVEVPLTLQFRTLSVRQVPLTRLPEIDWSGQ